MNNLGNKKICHFEIYYKQILEKSARTSYKDQFFNKNYIILISPISVLSSFNENLSDEALKMVTKNALQELISGLKNEDSDISYMLSPYRWNQNMEVHLTY